MPKVVTVDASASTVSVFPASIEDNGTEEATITVRVLNTDGDPMQGLAVSNIVISSTGSGNTIAALSGVTDRNGEVTTTIKSTVAATKTISATVCGAAITDTASLSVQVTGGTVATFTDISRDAANVNGGDTVLLTVSSIVGTPAVRFDGILATDITVVNATTISCVVPPNASTGPCDVVCGGVELANPRASKIGGDFEYLPAAATTLIDADFEGGVLTSAFSTALGTGAITVQTTEKYAGTYAVQAALTGSDTGGDECYIFNASDINVSSYANGIYVRYYLKCSAGTPANLGDQIKTWLFRTRSGSGQPGWLMTGIGPDFPGSGGGVYYVSVIDNGIINIGSPNQGISTAVSTDWNEFVQWQYWDAGTSEGRCKQWINGKLQFDVSNAALGGAGTDYRFRLGIPYMQNRANDCTAWVDEVFAGDGFPNPVTP